MISDTYSTFPTFSVGGLCRLCGKTNLEHPNGKCPDSRQEPGSGESHKSFTQVFRPNPIPVSSAGRPGENEHLQHRTGAPDADSGVNKFHSSRDGIHSEGEVSKERDFRTQIPDVNFVKLKALCEGLEIPNVPEAFDTLTVDQFKTLGQMIAQRARKVDASMAAMTDMCNLGHKFSFLPDHPVDAGGQRRCPHCLVARLSEVSSDKHRGLSLLPSYKSHTYGEGENRLKCVVCGMSSPWTETLQPYCYGPPNHSYSEGFTFSPTPETETLLFIPEDKSVVNPTPEVVAYLFQCKRPGISKEYATVDPDATEHYPIDEWKQVVRKDLVTFDSAVRFNTLPYQGDDEDFDNATQLVETLRQSETNGSGLSDVLKYRLAVISKDRQLCLTFPNKDET